MAKENRNKQIIPVFYGCDERFAKYMIVSLTSLIDHVSKNRRYEIHILHTDLSAKTMEKVSALSKENVTICFDDISDRIFSLIASLPVRDYYSPSTYFRILIPVLYPQFDKALYVDSDTCVVSDIAKLYDIPLGSNYVGAVPEAVMRDVKECGDYSRRVLGIRPEHYFNAGILSINCKQWRDHDILGQFITLIGFYQFVVAQDQDYLNVICKDKVKLLPRRFNIEATKAWRIKQKDQVIIHYAFVAKPWQDINCNYGSSFWKYASQTADYMVIKKGFAQVTDKELAAMAEVASRVYDTCRSEIDRKDNFLALLQKEEDRKPLETMPQFGDLLVRLQRA